MKSQSSTSFVLENSNLDQASVDSPNDLPYATHQKEEFLSLKSQLEAIFKEIKTLTQIS